VTSKGVLRTLRLFVFTGAGLLFIRGSAAVGQDKPEIPVVDAYLGRCTATFTVRDNQKPVYNAKINLIVRSGALGVRKTELQVGTNTEGKGRVAGLPEKTKKPLQFEIRYGELSKTILANPSEKCDATFDVDLGAK